MLCEIRGEAFFHLVVFGEIPLFKKIEICGRPWTRGVPIETRRMDNSHYQINRKVQTALDTLMLCGCCQDHQRGKRTNWGPEPAGCILNRRDNENPNERYERKGVCECDCRHMSRNLCSLHPDNFGIKFTGRWGWVMADLEKMVEDVEIGFSNGRYQCDLDSGKRKRDSMSLTRNSTMPSQDIGIVQGLGLAGVWG